ncbi:MAG TPA: protein kinase [Thermoanaerobaculia bacterium]|nr:protein kinase [Thermoanaerobaculia bacterium]
MHDPGAVRWHRSLSVRMFALAAGVLVLALSGAIALTLGVGGRRATEAARRAAERAASVQVAFQRQGLAQLELIAQVFADNPANVAYVVQSRDSGDDGSLLDFLADRREALGFDFAIVLDPAGVVVTRTDNPAARGRDLSRQPLVATALESYHAAGFWADDGRLYRVAVTPLEVGYTPEGFLVVGFALDDRFATELRQASDAQVVVLAGEPPDLVVAASTMTPEAGAALISVLEGRRAASPPATSWTEGPFEVDLAAERFGASIVPLGDPANPAGFIASLAAIAPELRPFRSIGRSLLLGGIAALALAAAGLLHFTRRMLAPLAERSAAARRASQGEYDLVVATGREDEVGALARAFDRLLSDLRERRDTEDYLSQLARTLPAEPAATPSGSSSQQTQVKGSDISSPPLSARSPALSGGQPVVGSVLGERFEILSVLGAGGMGVVYKAFDRSLGEVVALKTVKSADGDDGWLQRLKDEIRLARKVTHPNVLRTYEFTEADGLAFITMEYVRGVTLRYLLSRSGRLPYSAGLRLARDLCRGLEAAHAVGVLHRDIKPENLLIEHSGNAKLMDFGLARPVLRLEPGHTAAGEVLGTPDYFAPEQLRGEEATVRSDLYSSGVVLYEIFTAQRPFPERTTNERMLAKLRDDPTPPSLHWQRIPPELERLVLKCLARDPSQRYASASELLVDLEPLRA